MTGASFLETMQTPINTISRILDIHEIELEMKNRKAKAQQNAEPQQ